MAARVLVVPRAMVIVAGTETLARVAVPTVTVRLWVLLPLQPATVATRLPLAPLAAVVLTRPMPVLA